MTADRATAATLRRAGVRPERMEAVAAYCRRGLPAQRSDLRLPPFPPEPFAELWRASLPELQAPERRAACLSSLLPDWDAAAFSSSPGFDLGEIETSCARLPYVCFRAREDLARAANCLSPGKPTGEIPESLGALYLGRVRVSLRDGGVGEHPLVLLTQAPYAGVSAAEAGCAPEHWLKLSLVIRKAHEGLHDSLRRMRGGLALNLAEELAADFEGALAAGLPSPAKHLRRFLGLDDPEHGRWRAYVPRSLSGEAEAMRTLAMFACENLAHPRLQALPALERLALWSLTGLAHMANEQFESWLQRDWSPRSIPMRFADVSSYRH